SGSDVRVANDALGLAAAVTQEVVETSGLNITAPPNAGLTGSILNGKIDPKFILVTPVTGDVDSIKAGTISSEVISKTALKISKVTTVVSIFMAGADNFSNAEQLGGFGGAAVFTTVDVAVIVVLSPTGVVGIIGGIAFGSIGGSAGLHELVQENVVSPFSAGLRKTAEALQQPQPIFKRIFFPRVPDTQRVGQ
ncbi:hypothetical protein, partial [Sulfuriflexus sp.]|uniref:hypothetical protein n=1 Tax=Sulfuriflexus sp. TaxID=2015443 RepID=UPI0028CEE168